MQICTVSSITKRGDLDSILKKCIKEEDVDQQPLYVDDIDECIKCKWCPTWSGSQLVKRVNQHCKRDRSHSKARSRENGQSQSELQGVQDIRSFLSQNS